MKLLFLSVLAALTFSAETSAAIIYVSDIANVDPPIAPRFGALNTSDSSFAVESTTLPYYFGLAYDSSGALFGVTSTEDLVTVNPATGAVLSTIASGQDDSLASPTTGGTLYEVSPSGLLYTVDPTSGRLTLVGSLGISLDPDYEIGFGPDGNLYLANTTSFSVPAGASELYRINLSTGAAAAIGPVAERLTALVAVGSQLAGFTATSADGSIACSGCPEELVGLNTSTGAVTGVIATSLPEPAEGAQVQAAVEALSGTSTPEPNALWLIVAGIGLMAAAFKARKSML